MSDLADPPTPIISSPPLPSDIPALDFDFEPEPERHNFGVELSSFDNGGDRLAGDPPDVSPGPPLSPLLLQESHDVFGLSPDLSDGVQTGHTRSPVLAREPTMLENFSRTVRNYVPSSIPIPTAAPSPPRVSRPESFGSFMTTTGSMRIPIRNGTTNRYGYGYTNCGGHEKDGLGCENSPKWNDGMERESEHEGAAWTSNHYHDSARLKEGIFITEEGDEWGDCRKAKESSRSPSTSHPYPSQLLGEGDDIIWARWDSLSQDVGPAQQSRRLLFLGYTSGLQIWDCTNLASVSEILNLAGQDWGLVSYAGVLPRPRLSLKEDSTTMLRPVIGIITTIREESTFLVYSLYRHHVVKRLSLPGLATFSSNKHFIVISTINPPALHVLSPTTFATLYTISSAFLVPFYSAVDRPNISINVALSEIESENTFHRRQSSCLGQPVYTLSGRLLAYASTPPPPSSPTPPSSRQPQTQTQAHHRSSLAGLSVGVHMTQGDLSNVAMKVGGSVLSGMKLLGEKAYSVAMSLSVDQGSVARKGMLGARGEGEGTRTGRFFSRSAPAASDHERRYPTPPDVVDINNNRNESGGHSDHESSVIPHATGPHSMIKAGYYITVLDLGLLCESSSRTPRKVAEFVASKHQGISQLKFSGDGNSILVSPKDGQVLQIFQLRPTPASKGFYPDPESKSTAKDKVSPQQDAPWHTYDLHRGRTTAVIEGVDWVDDGRWIAIGTRKRTIHVFAVNPYGGNPDSRSHMEGRVRNYVELQPLSIGINPIVRLRAAKQPPPEQFRVPLAFSFIQSTELSLPATLLPPANVPYSSASGPSSVPKSEAAPSEPTSPRRFQRPSNFQDLLVFDPTDGILSLRRFLIELRTRDSGLSIPASVPGLGPTSISLPGMGAAGRLGQSPSTPSTKLSGVYSGVTQSAEVNMELVGRDSVIATWSLQRHQDWREIKRVIQEPSEELLKLEGQMIKADWLAQAELSTLSKSPQVLPRPIYLSHQFSFHNLGEDYHALIRRYQFDIGGSKLEVRKEVQISAYAAGGGESFVEGFSTAPRDIRRSASSFDEPLASALSGWLDYSPTQAILPMLPNGTPGSYPKSFRTSIPIRTMAAGLSDGMSEGLGRIRREIHKARSPPSLPPPPIGDVTGGSVPLEFDEAEEDFLIGDERISEGEHERDDDDTNSTSRGGGDSGASISTPSTNALPLEDEGDGGMWQGWDPEDKQAIEDAERFDDISVVGFLDEEHVSMVQAEKRRSRRRGF